LQDAEAEKESKYRQTLRATEHMWMKESKHAKQLREREHEEKGAKERQSIAAYT
jgi:hypothetical protein